jgi:septal ring factor EnvC (AmiA/AmiB activator)
MANTDPLSWWDQQFGICEHGVTRNFCSACGEAEAEQKRMEKELKALRVERDRLQDEAAAQAQTLEALRVQLAEMTRKSAEARKLPPRPLNPLRRLRGGR